MRRQRVVVERVSEAAKLPAYALGLASGADLYADEVAHIAPGKFALVSVGVRLELPYGYEAQIRPRSGLTSKGIMAAFGTIDCDYRGPIKVTLFNLSSEGFYVAVGDRIAQLVIAPVDQALFVEGSIAIGTERGEGGFGHTGR